MILQNNSPSLTSVWEGLRSILLNGGIVLAAWLAVYDNVPCGYVTKFLAAVTLVLSPLGFCALIKPLPPITRFRQWSSHLTDALTVAILVWHGWLWCAGAFAWGWLTCCIVFSAQNYHESKLAAKQ